LLRKSVAKMKPTKRSLCCLKNVVIDVLCVLQESTAVQIIAYFEGGQADLVVCDGAPDGNCQIFHESLNMM